MQQRSNQLAHAEAHGLVRRLGQRQERPQQLLKERVVVLVRLVGVALGGQDDDEPNQPFHRRLALRAARVSRRLPAQPARCAAPWTRRRRGA